MDRDQRIRLLGIRVDALGDVDDPDWRVVAERCGVDQDLSSVTRNRTAGS
jgi:hypothetical protein